MEDLGADDTVQIITDEVEWCVLVTDKTKIRNMKLYEYGKLAYEDDNMNNKDRILRQKNVA